jgi:hypothetical protein
LTGAATPAEYCRLTICAGVACAGAFVADTFHVRRGPLIGLASAAYKRARTDATGFNRAATRTALLRTTCAATVR